MKKVKKYSGDDDESLVQPYAGKYKHGQSESSSAGLRAEKNGLSLQTNLGKTEQENIGGSKREDYSPANIRAAYRQPIGEGSVSAGISRSNLDPHTQFRELRGDMPFLGGRLSGGLNEVVNRGERVGSGKNINYSRDIGSGKLMASLGKSGQDKSANLSYQVPFSKGGKVTASKRADGIAQRGKTRGKIC
jgi:hypothetical protein